MKEFLRLADLWKLFLDEMTFERLSGELTLHIHSHLDSWDDRLKFAQLEPYVWIASQQLRYTETLDLNNQTELNVLKLTCSKCIRLPGDPVRLSLLRIMIQYAYSVEQFIIDEPSSGANRFIKWFCKELLRVRAHKPAIKISVDHAHQDKWEHYVAAYGVAASVVTLGMKRTIDYVQTDLYDTPPEVNRFKDYQKSIAVLAGVCSLRSSNEAVNNSATGKYQSHVLPFHACSLEEHPAKRELDNLDAFDEDSLSPVTVLSTSAAKAMVVKLANRYLEAIVVFDNHWFYLTSLDCFLHERPTIDDCADRSISGYERHPVARIKEKGRFGSRRFYEVSIIVGNVELLAVGGFHGTNEDTTKHAFLGSSIKSLPKKLQCAQFSKTIFILENGVTSSFTNRILRQYAKETAGYKWGCHSLRFAAKGFYPVNPLAYTEHPASSNTNSIVLRLCSYFLKCVSLQTTRKKDIATLAKNTVNNPIIQKFVKDNCSAKDKALCQNGGAVSFTVINKAVSKSVKATNLTKAAIEAMAFLEKRANKVDMPDNLTTATPQVKDLCIQLFDKGFGEKLKSANCAAIKLYTTNHP